jgi:hypothetical protein
MKEFINLKGTLRGFWDENITRELTSAGIEVHPVPGHTSPQYRGTESLQGKLGEWTFTRDDTSYSFWGDVPLTMAERVAQDDTCHEGSTPQQWFSRLKESTGPETGNLLHTANIHWITPDGIFQEIGHNLSDRDKAAYIHDANGRLRFVDDPSIAARAFVRTYTFFTLVALKRFVEISNEERVHYKYTR